MERLTKRYADGGYTFSAPLVEITDRLAAYEDTGLTPEEIQEAVDLFQQTLTAEKTDIPKEIKSWVDRCTWHVKKCTDLSTELRKYKDAEEQGLIIRLPCKVGDTVYALKKERKIETYIVSGVIIGKNNIWIDVKEHGTPYGGWLINSCHFGLDAFLTREEAEAALAKEG